MQNLILSVHDLSAGYGPIRALRNVSIEVREGETVAVVGANGAGKTTAMRMLSGLLTPSSGQAFVAGFDVATQAELVKKNIGYMSQKFSLYEDLTIQENIEFYGGIYGLSRQEIKDRSKGIIDKFQLASVKNKLVKTIPLGWKQKLAFALALIHKPKVVFLDEPTGGVDPITRRQFWDLIYEAANDGVTIFITTHYMDEAEYCDRVSIMVDGLIKALGTPSELKNSFDVDSMDAVFQLLARGTANK